MSGQKCEFSDEILNALADRQFSPHEQAEKLRQVRDDAQAAAELCRLRDLKESVRTAYAEVPQAGCHGNRKRRAPLALAAAATVLLLLASTAILRHGIPALTPDNIERFALLDPQGHGQGPATAQDLEMRVVFHVQATDQVHAAELLDEVEGLLRDYHGRRAPVRVEVVAHGEGLGLLRSGLSTQRERIARMAQQYPALTFVACRNTIDRLKVEQGVEVVLLPEATATESGVAHVVRRQSEGWAYIQV